MQYRKGETRRSNTEVTPIADAKKGPGRNKALKNIGLAPPTAIKVVTLLYTLSMT